MDPVQTEQIAGKLPREKEKTTSISEKPKRLLSIDTLRGFDMLFIAGGGTFLVLMGNATDWPWLDVIAAQLKHPAWNGFTFYDFIFPLFLFIAGVSIPFSVNKGLSIGLGKSEIFMKAFKRMLILIILGIIYKNAPVPFFDPSEIRFGSVLGRIGIASFAATLVYFYIPWSGRVLFISAVLLLYYAALFLIPVPGYGAGDLTQEGNLVGWFDRTFMPGRLLQKNYDELGLLTQFPALCLTVLGAMAGDILRFNWKDYKKIQVLVFSGVAAIAVAFVWDLHFPINKHLWTSSFILLTGGMALITLAIFFWIIDVLKYQKWTFFFKVIGMNSLVIYLAYRFINFSNTSKLLFSGLYSSAPEGWHRVFEAIGTLGLVWLLLYFLYRQKVFLKV